MRWRLDLAYDGAAFSGWATQPGLRTVQGDVQSWLTRVLRTGPVELTCAGRTDAGVHARGQVAHVDLVDGLVPVTGGDELARRLNRVLAPDVRVTGARPAPAGFDARFAALWRRYVYRLHDGVPDPLLRGFVAAVPEPLDVAALQAAGDSLLGLRDFAPFCKRRDGASTVRTLLEVRAERLTTGPLTGTVELTVRADAFCHSMVRSLVGALTRVGAGRRDAAWLARVAAESARSSEVPVMPAHGLTLEEVRYPEDSRLAARAERAREFRVLPSVDPEGTP